ncbi:unnamed protein product [Protopolystoma xenopodis]|uniref:Uncharacterized protein n=1 Tax=Protopolystoma xenopodis TaxID=117903 RepID=A0A3S5CHJ5_9PLAT|nr:unnamed protein product [Protopolystoma xenopodis]
MSIDLERGKGAERSEQGESLEGNFLASYYAYRRVYAHQRLMARAESSTCTYPPPPPPPPHRFGAINSGIHSEAKQTTNQSYKQDSNRASLD